MDMGSYTRFSYTEENGAFVVLDINGDEVSMKRHDSGLTHGTFHRDRETSLQVHSEHGVLNFGVITQSLNFEGESLYIRYQLVHNGETIDTHDFKLSWKLEV